MGDFVCCRIVQGVKIVRPFGVNIACVWLRARSSWPCRVRDSALWLISVNSEGYTDDRITFAIPPPILLASEGAGPVLRVLPAAAAPGALDLRFLPKISAATASCFLRARSAEGISHHSLAKIRGFGSALPALIIWFRSRAGLLGAMLRCRVSK